jgi:hypothetical protein
LPGTRELEDGDSSYAFSEWDILGRLDNDVGVMHPDEALRVWL